MRKIITILGLAIVLIGCKDPYKDQMYKAFDDMTVSSYISSNPEYSEWEALLKKVDLYNALSLGTNRFTCFMATNDAVDRYLKTMTKYNSVSEMSDEDADFIMRYHILPGAEVSSQNLMLKLLVPTATGDYLTAGYDLTTSTRFIDNGGDRGRSYVVEGDIKVSNGTIHRLDNLLLPFTETIWSVLSADSRYSIFVSAIEACGLDAWLATSFRTIGTETIRENKTVFAVTDDVFKAKNINSIDDIKALYGGDPKDENSMFYQFVAYHCMDKLNGYAELTTFPEDYRSMTIYGCSKIKGISVLDTGEAVIFNDQEADKSFTISSTRRDMPTKNGYIHEIDNVMALPDRMAHYVVIWEPTDKVEYQVVPFYREQKVEGSQSQRHYFEENELPGIRWDAVPANKAQVWYHSEYVGVGRYLYNDALYWNMGEIGWLEMDIPVLPIGAYTFMCEKSNDATYGGMCKVYIDGKVAGDNSDRNFINGGDRGIWGTGTTAHKFISEESHTVRFVVSNVGGIIGIDRLFFVPEPL